MRPSRGRTERVAFRVTAEERAKLEWLAKETKRYPSQVMRLLLDQAELAGQRDIELKGPLEVKG